MSEGTVSSHKASLPYGEKARDGGQETKKHTNAPSLVCTTNSSIRAWAHLGPWDPHGTMSLQLTCVGGHSVSLGSGRQGTPPNHAKLELRQPAPCSSQPQAPGANIQPPPHRAKSSLIRYVPGLLSWLLGFSQAKPATLGLFLSGG